MSGGPHERAAAAKQALRAELLAARRALTPEAVEAARVAVADHLLAGLRLTDAVVAAYEPLRTEPGSTALLAALHASGRRVLVPLTLPDRDLDWVTWSPSGPSAPLGVAAVGAADVVVVPALAVATTDGARLGRGGGSYDRALPRTRGRVVALLHGGELLAHVPTDDHDRPVDAAVTPAGWWRRSDGSERAPGGQREAAPPPSR